MSFFATRKAGGPYVDFGNSFYVDDNEEYHREGDLPAMLTADGDKGWYIHGKLHRIGAPAVEHKDGGWEYFENGECHRDGAPAVHRADGTEDYYIRGHKLDDAEVKQMFNDIARREGKLTGAEVVAELCQGLHNAVKPLKAVRFGK
ncbi:MAG: hypothetical protein PW788_11120 [Micavibrio sp.]|nr:hypothetical protein [Micavibrio sp.]